MRRFLCMVLTGVIMVGCLSTSAGAVGEATVTPEECEVVETAITRATGSFNITIKANSGRSVDTDFPLAAGETVRIRANYTPEDASLDFGLIDPEGVFHYINVKTGSIDKTIEVPENGNYTLAIKNNSSKSVNVTGLVSY